MGMLLGSHGEPRTLETPLIKAERGHERPVTHMIRVTQLAAAGLEHSQLELSYT